MHFVTGAALYMKQIPYERCVVCGKLTDVPKSLPVGRRKTYVSGGGQLCKGCCWRIYGTTDLRGESAEEKKTGIIDL